ncbi:hypothetical protein Vretimale_12970 [Volvox reticuliferus]|uniref:Uncharacterized protein n=1 Tax=Volvox reticuliferus TaxID=1737510 RepID=A0A8J4FQE8_9CHLO|nr:hypothetical protein Vretifemale_9345 [Volvox reticuliferus]GIM09096.1 hypothetical protein Vretimale_12970 [Volvox reticuliferus]
MSDAGDNKGSPRSWTQDELGAAVSSWDPYMKNVTLTHRFLVSDVASLFLGAKASEAALFNSLGSTAARNHPDDSLTLRSSLSRQGSQHGSSQGNGGRRLAQQAPQAPPIPITSEDGSVLSKIGSFAFEFIVITFIDVPFPPSPPLHPRKPPNLPGILNPQSTPEKPPSSPPSTPYGPPGNILGLSQQLGATRVFRVLRPPPTPPRPPLQPPSPPNPPPRFVYVSDMPGLGAIGATRSLVWWDDPDFASQLRPYRALQLVDWNKRPCSVPNNTCHSCTRAWLSRKASFMVSVFFREPVQLETIMIHQLKSPAVTLVRLLAWPLNLNDGNANSTIGNGDGAYQYLGAPVYDAITNGTDPTPCNGVLNITIPPKLSGVNKPVSLWGSQSKLPIRLLNSVVAGVEVTVTMPTKPSQATVIESIRFKGRVLYPKNPEMYEQWAL